MMMAVASSSHRAEPSNSFPIGSCSDAKYYATIHKLKIAQVMPFSSGYIKAYEPDPITG